MNDYFDSSSLDPMRQSLIEHTVFRSVTNLPRLRVFMQNHVFPVWDFMSLLKSLQRIFAPHGSPWLPDGDDDIRRFINEIVTEEESDIALPHNDRKFISHFDLYRQSMLEIGADTIQIDEFIRTIKSDGLATALEKPELPDSSREFMRSTFSIIDTRQPHLIGSAFAFGRENIVPGMFKALLLEMKITKEDAQVFHYYLTRHTHLDEESHGPLALRMITRLCGDDPVRKQEALDTAANALHARYIFWDKVHKAIIEIPG